MNRDDIIRVARKAGLSITTAYGEKPALQRFAELVVAVEREACAKLCEKLAEDPMMSSGLDAIYCAEAIRARGQA